MKQRSVVLCGFMACGKSEAGKLLAAECGMDYMDTDKEAECMAGMTIPEMFERFGEDYFRAAEHEAAVRLAERVSLSGSSAVISTGGGFVTRRENFEVFSADQFLTVWIDRDPALCFGEVTADAGRPLGFGKSREELLQLYEVRKPLYEAFSRFKVTNDTSLRECVRKIKEYIECS